MASNSDAPQERRCGICKVPLKTTFYEREGQSYCEQDYRSKFLKRCKACREYILGPSIRVKDVDLFHPECFACSQCHDVIAVDENYGLRFGVPYCKSCFDRRKPIVRSATRRSNQPQEPLGEAEEEVNVAALPRRRSEGELFYEEREVIPTGWGMPRFQGVLDESDVRPAWRRRHPRIRFFRLDDLLWGKKLGQGFFGSVYQVMHKTTKELFAVKEMNAKTDSEGRRAFQREVWLLKRLRHPNILEFIGVFFLKDAGIYLITEFVAGGTLSKYIQAKEDFQWQLRVSFAADIAKGVAYLHANRIIHRDLTSDNCLIRSDMSVCVADFGLAKLTRDHLPAKMDAIGSAFWRAPEMYSGAPYNHLADVYSMGVIMGEMATRLTADELPRKGKYFAVHFDALRALCPNDMPPEYFEILVGCCAANPSERFSSAEAADKLEKLAHPAKRVMKRVSYGSTPTLSTSSGGDGAGGFVPPPPHQLYTGSHGELTDMSKHQSHLVTTGGRPGKFVVPKSEPLITSKHTSSTVMPTITESFPARTVGAHSHSFKRLDSAPAASPAARRRPRPVSVDSPLSSPRSHIFTYARSKVGSPPPIPSNLRSTRSPREPIRDDPVADPSSSEAVGAQHRDVLAFHDYMQTVATGGSTGAAHAVVYSNDPAAAGSGSSDGGSPPTPRSLVFDRRPTDARAPYAESDGEGEEEEEVWPPVNMRKGRGGGGVGRSLHQLPHLPHSRLHGGEENGLRGLSGCGKMGDGEAVITTPPHSESESEEEILDLDEGFSSSEETGEDLRVLKIKSMASPNPAATRTMFLVGPSSVPDVDRFV